ncbi:uncharacterized protein N7529_001587 [Penicillium soppii]|uniref:uncharacterized protein n=1 Tax=Penicillium soppii TaxID=69789 RepID=UPI00254681CB|nr:uncharacterized protein N7529_001587 [Penicillium soppii]KAJ5876003.1 hypothetical protein N7529_001587 [Penicillium soppii]
MAFVLLLVTIRRRLLHSESLLCFLIYTIVISPMKFFFQAIRYLPDFSLWYLIASYGLYRLGKSVRIYGNEHSRANDASRISNHFIATGSFLSDLLLKH